MRQGVDPVKLANTIQLFVQNNELDGVEVDCAPFPRRVVPAVG
jgi:hypothetical protein